MDDQEKLRRALTDILNAMKWIKPIEDEPPWIVINRAQCRLCSDVIVSRHRHDYVTCSCGAISVDGGQAYLKRSGALANIIELSVLRESE